VVRNADFGISHSLYNQAPKKVTLYEKQYSVQHDAGYVHIPALHGFRSTRAAAISLSISSRVILSMPLCAEFYHILSEAAIASPMVTERLSPLLARAISNGIFFCPNAVTRYDFKAADLAWPDNRGLGCALVLDAFRHRPHFLVIPDAERKVFENVKF
jgi:hypothetical protein